MQPTQTYNNQIILREIGQMIGENYGVKPEPQKSSLWSQIAQFFPTQETTGKVIGEHIVQTHGQKWSNQTIEFVVSKFFAPQPKEWSFWDYFSQVPQQTVTEVAKLAITPKVVPIMTLMAGVGGQIALPLVVSLVGIVYNKVMSNPYQVQQLANLELNDLFSIDPETGGLCDAFGRLLTEKDTRDVLAATAEYHLVAKLVELCQEIDKKYATPKALDEETLGKEELTLDSLNVCDVEQHETDQLKEEIRTLIQGLIKAYYIEREDGVLVFPSGVCVKEKQQKVINKAITVLESLNLKNSRDELKKAIHVLGKHSIYPIQLFKVGQLGEKDTPKSIPQVFQGENEWKNYIIQAEDGVCFLAKECNERKAGTIVPAEEMELILAEMANIQVANEQNQLVELKELLKHKEYAKLVESLNHLPAAKIRSFLKQHLIERQSEGKELLYLNGQILNKEEKQALLKKIALIPSRSDLATRTGKLKVLVEEIGSHMPKTTAENYVIKCSDGAYLNVLDDYAVISEEQAKQLITSIEIAELPCEEASKRIQTEFQTVDAVNIEVKDEDQGDIAFPSNWFDEKTVEIQELK